MPESGSTWQRAFPAQPIEARPLRDWVRARVAHPDAPAVASELFTAMAGLVPVVEVTVSTAGARVQITATGDVPEPPRLSGLGHDVVAGLAARSGLTTDCRGLWALLSDTHS